MDPSVGTPTAARLRSLLVLLCGALAVVLAANSALALALSDIALDLGADQTQLTWIVDAYALTFAALLLPAGIAADRVGRRTMLVGGLSVFAVASVASASAGSPAALIALRALAGAGAAAVFPVTLAALVDAYPAERRAFAVAVWSAVSAGGAVVGSLAAGLLLEVSGWGSIQVAFGVAAALLAVAAPGLVDQHRDRSLSFDPVGALLSCIGLGALVLGVIEAPSRGLGDPVVLAALGLATLALLGFVLHELRTPQPSLDVRLFRNRGLAAGSLLVSLQFFASLGLFVLAPQYLQLVDGLTALQAAVALLALPVGVGAGTGIAQALLARGSARLPGTAGLVVMAAGLAWLAASLPGPGLPRLLVGLVLFGMGFGLSVTPGTVLILDGLPEDRRSVASAVNDITREVGGVLGIAVLSSALLAGYRQGLQDGAVPPALSELASQGIGAALGAAGQLGSAGDDLAALARASFSEGFGVSLWVGCGVLLAAAVVVGLLAPARVAPSAPGAVEDRHDERAPGDDTSTERDGAAPVVGRRASAGD